MKKRYLLLLAIVLCVLLIAFILWLHKKTMPPIVETSLPVSEQKAYVDKINVALEKDRKERSAYEKIKDTPKEVAKRTKHWDKLKTFADSQLKSIEFYGKVIDQYGNPVPDMQVEYSGHSGYLSEGTGVARTRTNEQGVFTLTDAKGVSFSINKMNKLGYDASSKDIRANFYHYKRFEDSVLWQEYTEDNPYVFNVWKIERYPKVKKDSKLVGFKPNGKVYTLDFLSAGSIVKKEETQDGDLQVIFIRTENEWDVEIVAINGGLLVTDDVYRNLAPETGYVNNFKYSGAKEGLREVSKNMYFTSRNGEVYGTLSMDIIPYYRKNSVIDLSYVINLEKGRNLTVKQQR